MKAKFQSNEINELKDELYHIFNMWVERVTPTFEEPSVSLCHDGKGLFVAITDDDDYWALVTWEDFEEELLSEDNEVIKNNLPKLKSLIQKMEEELEGYQ